MNTYILKRKVSHRFRPSKKIVVVLLLLFLIGAVFTILEIAHVTNFIGNANTDTTVSSGPTEEQKQAQAKADAQNKQQLIDDSTKSTQSSTPSTPDSHDASSLSISAAQTSDNKSVTVLTKIMGVSDGSCKLVLKNGEVSKTLTASIIYQPQFSSCAGFTVPVTDLGAGNWSIEVTATPVSGTDMTQVIELQVH